MKKMFFPLPASETQSVGHLPAHPYLLFVSLFGGGSIFLILICAWEAYKTIVNLSWLQSCHLAWHLFTPHANCKSAKWYIGFVNSGQIVPSAPNLLKTCLAFLLYEQGACSTHPPYQIQTAEITIWIVQILKSNMPMSEFRMPKTKDPR